MTNDERLIDSTTMVVLTALAVALLVAGCINTSCSTDEDCKGGAVCHPETHKCYLPDGDAGADADAGDAGDAGPADAGDASDAGPADAGDAGDAEPECTGSSACTDPTAPICDATDLACRACQTHPECQSAAPAAPYCAAPRCVACLTSPHCTDDATPICEATTHQCRTCASHGECAARNASLPACTGSGACVACTDSVLHCSGTAPICEGTTHQCRPCASHGECAAPLGGGVCDWSTGACLDASDIIYVDATCSVGPPGDGTAGNPYCALQDGVDAGAAGLSTIILVADGTYDEIVVQDAGTVWIVGAGGAGSSVEILASFTPSSAVYLSGSTTLTLENVTIRSEGGTGAGVECDGNITTQPTLTVRQSTVTGNAGGGVTASNCTVTLDGNEVTGNAGGGVSLSSSDFTVTNNIIAGNGSPSAAFGGVSIFQPGGIAVFDHNTVVGNDANIGEGGIACFQPVSITSTIVSQNINADLSPSCTATFSWTTTDGDPQLDGTYHLQAGSGCIDQGDPSGTLDHDIDGDSRPQGGGPDIGADEAQ